MIERREIFMITATVAGALVGLLFVADSVHLRACLATSNTETFVKTGATPTPTMYVPAGRGSVGAFLLVEMSTEKRAPLRDHAQGREQAALVLGAILSGTQISEGCRRVKDFIRKQVSRQFGKPTGLLGRMIERRMSKRTIGDAKWTVSLLHIEPKSRVLEIGFGGGVSTQLASQEASEGLIAGIDLSKTMVEVARERNADAIKAGRMELNQGDAASLAYPDDSFDILFSLHSIYFWTDPLACLKGFRRVLRPGGLLAITIQPKDRWSKEQIGSPGLSLFFGDQVAQLFSFAGFQNVRTESFTENGVVSLQCILGTK